MPGMKRKSAIDPKEVAACREKLRKCEPPSPVQLTNEERQKYTFKSPFPQKFLFPSNIIYYASRNPFSPNCHLRFLSTCKAFLRLSRILPFKKLEHNNDENDCNKWEVDEVKINLNKQFFKLWIYNNLYIWNLSLPNLASNSLKHIYKCSLQELALCNQVLTFEELQFLVSGGNLETVVFYKNVIKNADGSITKFEDVFELLCCIKMNIYLPVEHHGIDENTTKKIIQILSSKQKSDVQAIRLWNISQNLVFPVFYKLLKAHMRQVHHSVNLWFTKEISDIYKNQVQQFQNEISRLGGSYAHTAPIIEFCGKYREIILSLQCKKIEGFLRKRN